jgi:hypothetical protein
MAASKPPPSKRTGADLKGQAKVIYEVRRLVDEWRGFQLGVAADPYPVLTPALFAASPPRFAPPT